MTEQTTSLLIVALIIGIPLAFGIIWCAVSILIGWLSGWSRLARRYKTERKPTGKSLPHFWLMLGPASYRGVTTVQPEPEGLYFTIMVLFCLGHPPLLIPWSDVTLRGDTGTGLFGWVTLELGKPKITTLRLQNSEKTRAMLARFLNNQPS